MMRTIDVDNCDEATRRSARALYVRYCQNSDNKNFRGEECPAWDGLGRMIQSHWCAVATAAREQNGRFARERVTAMRARPRSYAVTRDSFLAQLELLAETGGFPWTAHPSGLSPTAELVRRLCPNPSVDTGALDDAWARERCDITLAFLDEACPTSS